jgi:sterol desaturase/sphingolipid hydroxylase (fatty acid hydroxylase superfamily)
MLHWKPRQVMGRRIDPLIARKHRAHHRDPKDAELVFVPMPVLLPAVTVGAALYLLLLPTMRLGVTTMAAAYTMFLVYEWTHFLIHSTYRPKTRVYRYVWRAHRLHHYRNERYWFGVTMHLADHVLGTFPEKDAVPASDTARTLGVAETVR